MPENPYFEQANSLSAYFWNLRNNMGLFLPLHHRNRYIGDVDDNGNDMGYADATKKQSSYYENERIRVVFYLK